MKQAIKANRNKFDNTLVEEVKNASINEVDDEEEDKNNNSKTDKLKVRAHIANRIYRSDSSDEEDEEEKKGPILVLSNKIVLPEHVASPPAGLTKVENLTSVKLKYGSNVSSKNSEKQ